MKIGTKSVFYGAHAFWLHPWFVAAGWWRLYGFPVDPRLWVAFWVHDLGYLGRPNMDGDEGERHPELGARLMLRLFDRRRWNPLSLICNALFGRYEPGHWHDFVLYHSRFYAKADGEQPSALCMADKLAIALTPAWLYLPMVRATGEIHEYRKVAHDRGEAGERLEPGTLSDREEEWYAAVQAYMRRYVEEHRDGKPDSWTVNMREARDQTGVWR